MLKSLLAAENKTDVPLLFLGVAASLVALPFGIYKSLCLYQFGSKPRKDRPWTLIPGWIPILGHFHLVGSLDYLLRACEGWADEYGTANGCFDIDLVGTRYTVVCNAQRAQEILQHRPRFVERATIVREVVDSVGATGVFSAEGDMWRKEHKLVAAALNRNNMQTYLPVFRKGAERLVNKWTGGGEMDPASDMLHVAADAIADIALGQDFDFLNKPTSTMAHDVSEVMLCFRRALSPIWYWRIPVIGQYLDGSGWSVDRVKAMLKQVVPKQGGNSKSVFVQKLYDAMKSEDSYLAQDRVMGNIFTLFIAGIDTTAKMFGACLYQLAKNPELQSTLQQEVDKFDLSNSTLDDFYTKLPRLKAFLHEMHRFHGNNFIFLKLTKDIDFCGGTLKKGEEALLFARYLTTSDKAQTPDIPAGPNEEPPSVFCPERYLTGDGTATATPKPGSLAFSTFGVGARACPGRTYSEVFTYTVLIRLLQTFSWTLPVDFPENPILLNQQVAVTESPVRIILRKR
jgi:cytochrome P450